MSDLDIRLVDLHTHSTASDGTDNPTLLVENAVKQGVVALALTDHDTIAGLEECQAAGQKYGVEVIRGCEISTETEVGSVHILGLWLPEATENLENLLAWLRNMRDARNVKILEKLSAYGLKISMEEVKAKAKGQSVGRPHIAAVLLEKGYCQSREEVFKDWLGNTGKAYLPRQLPKAEEAVEILHKLGATVCWAHPMLNKVENSWREDFVQKLLPHGLDAIEVWHSAFSESDVSQCFKLASKYNLAMSGGTDYHGANKPGINLGLGYGKMRIPYSVLENLKNYRQKQGLPV